ncbi:MAG: hypothetical protein JWO92_1116 [Chitinophagaceae bacterium]|nr:hypothetical protein [Chitinophagaceae bacterium]
MKRIILISIYFISCTATKPTTVIIPTINDDTVIVIQEGKDGKDGYSPRKGVDYNDGKDGYTPRKGIDYFDGKDGITTVINGSSSVINVKDYGAKGDGITDDTKAFQAVLNMLISDISKGNFKIIIPKGDYLCGHLETPNSASFFTIEGEGMGVSNLLFIGDYGEDFITLINSQRIAIKNLSLIPKNHAGKMINILRTENKNGEMGFVGDGLLENIDMPAYRGKGFSKGIVFSCTGLNNSASDANNEQWTIRKCYAEQADSFGISFEHQNSLWHGLYDCRFSGYVADINNIRDDGSSGGGFEAYSCTLMPLVKSSVLLRLTGSQYPITISNLHSEGNGQALVTSKSSDGLLLDLILISPMFKLGEIGRPHFDVGVGTTVMIRDGFFFSSNGISAKVDGELLIHGRHGNLYKIENNGFVAIDFYDADAPLLFSGNGKIVIGDSNTGNLHK